MATLVWPCYYGQGKLDLVEGAERHQPWLVCYHKISVCRYTYVIILSYQMRLSSLLLTKK